MGEQIAQLAMQIADECGELATNPLGVAYFARLWVVPTKGVTAKIIRASPRCILRFDSTAKDWRTKAMHEVCCFVLRERGIATDLENLAYFQRCLRESLDSPAEYSATHP